MNIKNKDRGSRIEDRVKIRTEEKGLGRAKRGVEDAGCKVHRAEGLTQSSILSVAVVALATGTARPTPCGCNPQSSHRFSKGFTLIELIVAITIVVFLMGMLLTRIWFYQEQAERAAMEQVAGALQTALVIQYAHLLTRGREAEVKNLVSENPTRWLMQKPRNYAGEYFGMTPAAITPGSWAFDLKTRELIYVPDRSEYFVPGKDGLKWVRYRARLQYERVPEAVANKDTANKDAGELTGVLFEPVERYQWFIRGEK